MSEHIVVKSGELKLVAPPEFAGRSEGYRGHSVVDEPGGAVQMGFRMSELEAGGSVDTHVHSFEETLYVVSGELVIDTPGECLALVEGDYALLSVGVPHAFRNLTNSLASFIEMKAPLPRQRTGYDTQFPEPLSTAAPRHIDVRDPRNRTSGHIDPANMEPGLQTQDRLALSASMRTALLVYSGISVKMMIDSDLGADLSTMFMVQYEPGGFAGAHDHPLEEAYLILEGEVEAKFDGVAYHLSSGDVAWAGVGCVHEFRNVGEGKVRWLETQAPQPPPRHSYRFARDWTYLESVLAAPQDSKETR